MNRHHLLYSQMPAALHTSFFDASSNGCRNVIFTNIAETSLIGEHHHSFWCQIYLCCSLLYVVDGGYSDLSCRKNRGWSVVSPNQLAFSGTSLTLLVIFFVILRWPTGMNFLRIPFPRSNGPTLQGIIVEVSRSKTFWKSTLWIHHLRSAYTIHNIVIEHAIDQYF